MFASVILDKAIAEVTSARTRVTKIHTVQVRGVDDVASLKATADAWFRSHRPLVATLPSDTLRAIDALYNEILVATSKHAAKNTYLTDLASLKKVLVAARAESHATPAVAPLAPPKFSPLAGNAEMEEILTRRWYECQKCVNAQAHLAAIVMMGGLLEALFVSRAIKMPDKAPLLNAKGAPKVDGKTVELGKWMLDSYIKVGRELGWISESAERLADVLKEYRNYVHPEKERRHGIVLELNDSTVFWNLTTALTEQLLQSAT